jgi:hypothetical protein
MLTDFYYIISSLSPLAPEKYYPNNLPQTWTPSSGPVCVYSIEGSNTDHYLSGLPVGSVTSNIKLEIIGNDSAEVDDIASGINGLLDGYSGFMNGHKSIWTLNDEIERSVYWGAGDQWLYLREQTYNVRWFNPGVVMTQEREFSFAFAPDFAHSDIHE